MGTAACGCVRTILVAEDCIVNADNPGQLIAYTKTQSLLLFTKGLPNQQVRFFVDEKASESVSTDLMGRASRTLDKKSSTHTYKVRAEGEKETLIASGSIHRWDADRPAIAVDLDETISQTEYIDLIWGSGMTSRPMQGSPEALRKLSKEYYLVYCSARPRFMLDQTRKWLVKHKFPRGPIILASDFRASLRQAAAKKELFADLRRKWPNVRVGIGDKNADVEACLANDMLPVIVNGATPLSHEDAVVVPDWKSLVQFFDDNRTSIRSFQSPSEVTKKHSSLRAGR